MFQRWLLIHQPRHLDAVPSVARHLEVTEQSRVGNGALAEPGTDAFHGVFYAFPFLTADGIIEHGQLLRVFLWDEVYCSHADGAHLLAPLISLLEHPEAGSRDFIGKLCPHRQLSLILVAVEVIAPDVDLDASCR